MEKESGGEESDQPCFMVQGNDSLEVHSDTQLDISASSSCDDCMDAQALEALRAHLAKIIFLLFLIVILLLQCGTH